jgi:hypothetical protein
LSRLLRASTPRTTRANFTLRVRHPRPLARYAPASSSRVFPECRLPQSGMIPFSLHLFEICVEALNGKPVDWKEKVSDQQYQLGLRSWSLGIRYQLFVNR